MESEVLNYRKEALEIVERYINLFKGGGRLEKLFLVACFISLLFTTYSVLIYLFRLMCTKPKGYKKIYKKLPKEELVSYITYYNSSDKKGAKSHS